MIPFNYHHLYYFYIVATEGSVSKAAQKLLLAQPTLSAQLKQFEQFLDVSLFDREGKKLILTEEGSNILSYAKSIFDLGKELSDTLKDHSEKGRIKLQIGVASFIPKTFIDQIIKFVLNKEPNIYLNLVENHIDELILQLKNHKLDFIFNDFPHLAPTEEGIENSLIGKIPVIFCANKQLAKKYPKIPEDLNKAPLYLPTAQSQTFHQLEEFFLENKIQPHIMGEIQDIELVRRLVLEGYGIAPLNRLTAMEAPSSRQLVQLKMKKELNIYESIYLIRKKRKKPHPILEIILNQFKFKSISST